LGHRRLSVLDVSSAGAQPMRSACGRYQIVYNGEVYNHLDLRLRLESERRVPDGGWRGHADTETLLAAVAAWGFERTLEQASGMFAIALWDTHEGVLWLARDRFGEKPLYVARVAGGVLFASEIKALAAHPGFRSDIDRAAQRAFLYRGYVPAPRSIFRHVTKLLPGSYVALGRVGLRDLADDGDFLAPARRFYWRLADVVERGVANPFIGSEDEAVDALEKALGDAVEAQRLSDVPLGAFLSGGIDSSLVVALMQARSSRPVHTFTIGFEERAYDESPYAAAVARHLGTEHTEAVLSQRDALDRIRLVPGIWDEPFADVSQLPTRLVCEVARGGVTVALSGDGGDELFGGYERYGWTEQLWGLLRWLPPGIRRAVAATLRGVPVTAWDRLLVAVPVMRRTMRPGDRLHKLAALIPAAGPNDLYAGVMTAWKRPEALMNESLLIEASSRDEHWSGYPRLATLVETLMYRDAVDYLPDDLMVKVDRAAMSVSLETRAPFLDRDVAELAWRLPLPMKRRGAVGKWLLRRLLDRYVPRQLIDRPKVGFTVPLGDWLRGPLRGWAEDLLAVAPLEASGIAARPVRELWAAHLGGRENHPFALWNVLMYQAWDQERR